VPDFLFVSQAARELGSQLGAEVRPQDLSNLFYRRALRADLCPVVGGRRLIPCEYLATIKAFLLGRVPRQKRGQGV
jgi:hypothetical protein